jgi:glycosyltransferase involved in cell wall biosynthesis
MFVLSTHWEGMPLALVEAMAAGCACVASDVDGVQGVIEHEVTGLLVPESDAPALADALARLLTEPGLAERLGAAARQRALAEHGQALMLARYEAVLGRGVEPAP